MNANLPLPTNAQENEDFRVLFREYFNIDIKAIALDANDVAQEGEWTDSSSNKLNYTNWLNVDSNGHIANNEAENFAVQLSTGQWADKEGSLERNVVCEKPVKRKFII